MEQRNWKHLKDSFGQWHGFEWYGGMVELIRTPHAHLYDLVIPLRYGSKVQAIATVSQRYVSKGEN